MSQYCFPQRMTFLSFVTFVMVLRISVPSVSSCKENLLPSPAVTTIMQIFVFVAKNSALRLRRRPRQVHRCSSVVSSVSRALHDSVQR